MPDLRLWFDHGWGDCSQFAALMQLYKRRGWNIQIHHEQNKEPLWRAAGLPFDPVPDRSRHHGWIYPRDFNRPKAERDSAGSKLFGNINRAPLPAIGNADELWEELCDVELDGSSLATPELRAETDRFLAHLAEPIVLVHTRGTNYANEKSLPDDTAKELYRHLLDGMDGSLILLDWDQRVPRLPSGRVRHLKEDWGHISIDRYYCLLERSRLMIGVDSGPFHFMKFCRVPALGVFHHFYPSCVCLPRPETAHMTRAQSGNRIINIGHRRRWNTIEYAEAMPTGEEIAEHALRMLNGPRYLRDPRRIGRDAQLQQWIQDWCRGSTDTSWLADRSVTLDWLLRETTRRFESPNIVEVGCLQSSEDWAGSGNSTYLLGAYLDGLGTGQLISVDDAPSHVEIACAATRPWGDRVRIERADPIQWLHTNTTPIDVLYVNAHDKEGDPANEALRAIEAAEPHLGPQSLIVLDATVWCIGWQGAGSLAIGHLLDQGWKVVSAGYQMVLSRS